MQRLLFGSLALLAVAAVIIGLLASLPEKVSVVPLPPVPDATTLITVPETAGQPSDPSPPVEGRNLENLLQRLLQGGEGVVLSEAEVQPYLEANQRSAASLLTATRVAFDAKYFEEAAARFPDDPRVAFHAFSRAQDAAEKRRWLEVMARSDTNNSLPYYLLAEDAFKSGNTAEARAHLEKAAARPALSVYGNERILDAIEAYRAAGLSDAVSKLLANSGLPVPHLASFKGLARAVAAESRQLSEANQPEAAAAVWQQGFQIGERLNQPNAFLIEQLVGLAVQRELLAQADPAAPSPLPGQTNGELAQSLQNHRLQLREMTADLQGVLSRASEEDLVLFFDRSVAIGELQAIRWLRERYSQGAGGGNVPGQNP